MAVKRQKEVEEEKRKTERTAIASENAVRALQKARSDPTMALNMAIWNYKNFPGESSAAAALNQIISDTTNHFYKQRYQVPRSETNSYNELNTVVFSPSGKSVLAGSRNGTAVLWSIDGKKEATFYHDGSVYDAAFSPNGEFIVTCTGRTAILWDLKGNELKNLNGHQSTVFSIAFSPDGKYILTGSDDTTARLWDLNGDQLVVFSGHTQRIRSVNFSPDGKLIVTGSVDQTAKLWNLDGKLMKTFRGHTNGLSSVEFSPDGKNVLTASADKTAKLFDLNGNELRTFRGHNDIVGMATFSPKGDAVLTGSDDNTAKLWSLKDASIRTFIGGGKFGIFDVAFSPDGSQILTASNNGEAKLWNLEGSNIQTWFLQDQFEQKYIGNYIFSQDLNYLLFTSISDNYYRAEDQADTVLTLMNIAKKQMVDIMGHDGPVNCYAFSPDGQFIITGSKDSTVKLWDLKGQELRTFSGHKGSVYSIAFSLDGQYIVSGSEDNTAKLWDRNGKELRTFSGHLAPVSGIACLMTDRGKNGYVLTETRDGVAKLWNLEGNELWSISVSDFADENLKVDFSEDGAYLLFSDRRFERIFDLEGKEIIAFQSFISYGVSFHYNSIVLSPNSEFILTNAQHNKDKEDNSAKLRDLEGNIVQTFEGHSTPVVAVSFSPDGNYILTGTGSGENTAILWDLNGNLLQTFYGHDATVFKAIFSNDGKNILTVSTKGTLKLWKSIWNYVQEGVMTYPMEELEKEGLAIEKDMLNGTQKNKPTSNDNLMAICMYQNPDYQEIDSLLSFFQTEELENVAAELYRRENWSKAKLLYHKILEKKESYYGLKSLDEIYTKLGDTLDMELFLSWKNLSILRRNCG